MRKDFSLKDTCFVWLVSVLFVMGEMFTDVS